MKKINNLKFLNNVSIYFDQDKIKNIKIELDDFLKNEKEMNNLKFSKKVMFSQELKANNTIEGYLDNISTIEEVIKNKKKIEKNDKNNRIINLYKGYQYILDKKPITKDNLRELYKLLSNGLLSYYDLEHMGDYYRNDDVFIYYSDDVSVEPEKGINTSLVDEYMELLIEYLNTDENIESPTDYFIKSQIAHFYFVYIHPYFDINGRTSRTTSMWYLLQKEAYPYIIFNRAILLSKNNYYKQIRNSKSTHNITRFIEFMLKNTKIELEKEYIMQTIKNTSNEKLDSIDYQTLHGILSMNSEKTLKDYAYIYNIKNEKKKIMNIYNEMIKPLIEKEIIECTGPTKSKINNSFSNFHFKLNDKNLDLDKSMIKLLKI